MALGTIIDMVHARVPWLTAADDPAIQAVLEEQYVVLQPWTQLSDADSELEASYTKLQRLLLKEMTAYQLVVLKAAETTGGKHGVAAGGRVVKKAKADVVETEFESIKLSDGTTIALNTQALLDEIRQAACGYARTLGYILGLCSASGPAGDTVDVVPFITLIDADLGYWPGLPFPSL